MIKFNEPYSTGSEVHYINDALQNEKQISGNGKYTKLCQSFFEEKYGIRKCLLTTSCTDALEMAAILCDIQPGDEVIIPSYTFVSTALAFVRQGAKIIFADSYKDNPNIDPAKLESLITANTKAIVPVHYAGVSCDMNAIMKLAEKYNLFVIEDAAQAVDSYYNEQKVSSQESRALGSIGHLAAFSFHETKNIISGEGGMLAINDDRFIRRAEIIWEKGTNRAEFFRGIVNKYGWVDIGSSFLPSEIIAAFLWAQIQKIKEIQQKRVEIWEAYYQGLKPIADKGYFSLPCLPEYATNNGHMFYLVCRDLEQRTKLISFLKQNGIISVFHYLSLHNSQYYVEKHDGRELINCDHYADCIIRLPLYYKLSIYDVSYIIDKINRYFNHYLT
jgi:dTDP-4-amino-4,6-dideoxygalactose transaminase